MRGRPLDPQAPETLTERERELLAEYSRGVRVGDLTGGPETVKSHLKRARQKLEATSTGHAACEAMRRKWIQ